MKNNEVLLFHSTKKPIKLIVKRYFEIRRFSKYTKVKPMKRADAPVEGAPVAGAPQKIINNTYNITNNNHYNVRVKDDDGEYLVSICRVCA